MNKGEVIGIFEYYRPSEREDYSNKAENQINMIKSLSLRNLQTVTQNIPVYNSFVLQNVNNYYMNDLNRVLMSYIDYKGKEIASMSNFLINLPKTKELINTGDFNVIVNDRLFVYFIVSSSIKIEA